MKELIDRWRREAANTYPPTTSASLEIRSTLNRCANELEQVWHFETHDATWKPSDCPVCRKEMEESGLTF